MKKETLALLGVGTVAYLMLRPKATLGEVELGQGMWWQKITAWLKKPGEYKPFVPRPYPMPIIPTPMPPIVKVFPKPLPGVTSLVCPICHKTFPITIRAGVGIL